jgi:hypothetical protein
VICRTFEAELDDLPGEAWLPEPGSSRGLNGSIAADSFGPLAELRLRYADHLAGCDACRRALAERRLLGRLMADLPDRITASPSFAAGVLAALARPETEAPGMDGLGPAEGSPSYLVGASTRRHRSAPADDPWESAPGVDHSKRTADEFIAADPSNRRSWLRPALALALGLMVAVFVALPKPRPVNRPVTPRGPNIAVTVPDCPGLRQSMLEAGKGLLALADEVGRDLPAPPGNVLPEGGLELSVGVLIPPRDAPRAERTPPVRPTEPDSKSTAKGDPKARPITERAGRAFGFLLPGASGS